MMVFALVAARPVLAGEVQQRVDSQEKRIDQGVDSGQLTPKEAGTLESKEAQIEKNRETALSDGKMTREERRKLNRQENRQSRRIKHKKHNARKDQPVTTNSTVTSN